MPPGGLTDGRTDALVQPNPFLDPLVHLWLVPAQSLLQHLTFPLAFGRTGVRGRKHLAIAREHLGIHGVHLRLVAAGTREGAHP